MEVVLASANPGKLGELRALAEEGGLTLRAQSDFGINSVAETGVTFVENALLKARHAARGSGLPAVADDSGLMVDALAGAPGVYSARYAGAGASDAENLRKLLTATRQLADAERGCRFVCVMVWLRAADDPLPVIACGVWEGRLARAPRGDRGFGYDPVFHVPEYDCTAAELEPAIKNRISHRGRAMAALRASLRGAGPC